MAEFSILSNACLCSDVVTFLILDSVNSKTVLRVRKANSESRYDLELRARFGLTGAVTLNCFMDFFAVHGPAFGKTRVIIFDPSAMLQSTRRVLAVIDMPLSTISLALTSNSQAVYLTVSTSLPPPNKYRLYYLSLQGLRLFVKANDSLTSAVLMDNLKLSTKTENSNSFNIRFEGNNTSLLVKKWPAKINFISNIF